MEAIFVTFEKILVEKLSCKSTLNKSDTWVKIWKKIAKAGRNPAIVNFDNFLAS